MVTGRPAPAKGKLGETALLYKLEFNQFQLKVLCNQTGRILMAMMSATCDRKGGIWNPLSNRRTRTLEDIAQILSKNVRFLMAELGMQQIDLAEKMGVSKSMISLWLSRRSTPTTKQIPKLAEIFGISMSALLNPDLVPDDGVKISLQKALKIIAEDQGYELRSKRDRRKKPTEDDGG